MPEQLVSPVDEMHHVKAFAHVARSERRKRLCLTRLIIRTSGNHDRSRVRRSLLRGESLEVMTQLGVQETPSSPTLQEFLSTFGVFALRVSLVINELPWTTRFRCE